MLTDDKLDGRNKIKIFSLLFFKSHKTNTEDSLYLILNSCGFGKETAVSFTSK